MSQKCVACGSNNVCSFSSGLMCRQCEENQELKSQNSKLQAEHDKLRAKVVDWEMKAAELVELNTDLEAQLARMREICGTVKLIDGKYHVVRLPWVASSHDNEIEANRQCGWLNGRIGGGVYTVIAPQRKEALS